MSIEVELNGKAGRCCPEALAGTKRCPLIVRTTSEDVLVGNVFGLLKHIRPYLWLNPLLNLALYGDASKGRFRQVWFKDFRIRFWERQERFPPELLDFREGRTEPDIIIEWENPPTSVWIEAKYQACLAEGTANNPNNDQVIRGIRTLLAATGHICPQRLFHVPKRQAVWLALLSNTPDPMVEAYRDAEALREAIPYAVDILAGSIVGAVAWQDVHAVLATVISQGNASERSQALSGQAYVSQRNAAPRGAVAGIATLP